MIKHEAPTRRIVARRPVAQDPDAGSARGRRPRSDGGRDVVEQRRWTPVGSVDEHHVEPDCASIGSAGHLGRQLDHGRCQRHRGTGRDQRGGVAERFHDVWLQPGSPAFTQQHLVLVGVDGGRPPLVGEVERRPRPRPDREQDAQGHWDTRSTLAVMINNPGRATFEFRHGR